VHHQTCRMKALLHPLLAPPRPYKRLRKTPPCDEAGYGLLSLMRVVEGYATIVNRYHLVICYIIRNGTSPFLRTVNHLFRLGPWLNHGYVSHNQRVNIEKMWEITKIRG